MRCQKNVSQQVADQLEIAMTEAFTKADMAKVKKWEKALDSLKTGERININTTLFLGIKSLCHDKELRQAYCYYLFSLIKNKFESASVENNFEVDLINEVSEALEEMKGGNDVRQRLLDYQHTFFNYREELEKHGCVNNVRLISYSESLTLAYLIRTLLSKDDSYGTNLYYATRMYVEKYNDSRGGTGLIYDSIPFFEDVLDFWRGVALSTKLNASRK